MLLSVMICLKNGKFATFVFISLQLKLQYFKCSESVVSKNNHALPDNIVLMYYKVFIKIEIQVFKKNAKTKVYALEDSLGVEL